MAISLTKTAAEAIESALRANDLSAGYGLRVRQGGDGFALDIEAGPTPSDRASESHGVAVFCDKKTYLLAGDLLIDYRAEGDGFVVQRIG